VEGLVTSVRGTAPTGRREGMGDRVALRLGMWEGNPNGRGSGERS